MLKQQRDHPDLTWQKFSENGMNREEGEKNYKCALLIPANSVSVALLLEIFLIQGVCSLMLSETPSTRTMPAGT